MKITLDSTEPLEDALQVLGAMYGVKLAVSGDQETTKLEEGVASETSSARAPKRKRAGSKRSRPAAARARTASGGSKRRSVSGAGDRPSNAEVRAWARQNGLGVNDRGRVAGAVMAAYRSANGT